MGGETKSVSERAVDSLQEIYAVVIALAIAQAIESLLRDPVAGGLLDLWQVWEGLPAFIAILFTLVPFWHGMNRHLDRCYVEKKNGDVEERGLLFDCAIFFVEATLLFAAGWSLRSGVYGFIALGCLLLLDSCWALTSHRIHFHGKTSHAIRWACINFVAIGIAILCVAIPSLRNTIALMAIAIGRTYFDYKLCWDFYFPKGSN